MTSRATFFVNRPRVATPFSCRSRSILTVTNAIKVGDKAPTFSLNDQDGKNVQVKFDKPTVLFFYPKDNTPGCTLEAKSFADAHVQFVKRGAKVIGISGDSVDSHKSFCTSLNLPYTLLSDEGDKVRKLYGVPADMFGLLPGRQTYVIGKDGIVKIVFNNQLDAKKHVEEAMTALA